MTEEKTTFKFQLFNFDRFEFSGCKKRPQSRGKETLFMEAVYIKQFLIFSFSLPEFKLDIC